MGKLFSSRFYDKFQSVFRILIASLDQSIDLAKVTTEFLWFVYDGQKKENWDTYSFALSKIT